MIGSLAAVVRHAAERLADEYKVDATLDEVAAAMDRAATPSEAVALAKRLLRQRSSAMRGATLRIDQLRTTFSHLAGVLAFTEEGWPERKQELEALLADGANNGLAAWLGDWFRAATYRRIDALERLVTDVDNLPAGSELLLERCATAASGLAAPSWYSAHALLAAGAAGMRIGGEAVPAPDVQEDAWLLLGRLALADFASEADERRRERLLKTADAALRAAGEEHEPSPRVAALRARWHRLRGDHEPAAAVLATVAVDAATDLDVASELVEEARAGKRWEVALDTARSAVDALPTLADIDAELSRLVEFPAELAAAVAERAFDEGEGEIYEEAAARAESLAAWNDYPLRATLADLRCRAADADDAPAGERAAAYVTAGNQRLWAGQLELAVRHFEAALSLDPRNVDAALGVADCLVVLSSTQPASQSGPTVERALSLILDVQRRDAVNAGNSWCYLIEADARKQLARLATPEADDHRWRALLAVCRSLAFQPEGATRWVDLAGAADELELYALADAASSRALEVDPGNSEALSSRAQALTNGGRLGEALELLGDEPWDQAVQAYILIRLGRPDAAVGLLRSIELSPTWSWANDTLIMALVLTGRYDDARYEADLYRERYEERLSEQEAALSVAFACLVMGDAERAEEIAAPFSEDDSNAAWIVGNAKVVRGDVEAGLEKLAHSMRLAGSRDLDDWERLSKPFLIALAGRRGVTVPSFEPVEEAVAQRRLELERLEDPVAELAAAEGGNAPPEVVALAKAMGAAALQLASDDPAAALAALDALPPQPGDHAFEALRREATIHTLARDAVAAARQGTTKATSFLRELLALAPGEAGSLIGAEADGDSELLERLAGELRSLAGSSDDTSPAAGAPTPPGPAATAPAGTVAPGRALEAVLPASWFAEHPDPLNDHPLFLRYIPELRARATWSVPAINVRTDVELEPDRYEIWVLDERVAGGRAHPAYVYAEGDVTELLGPGLSAAAEPDGPSGWKRIPRSALAGSGGFMELLTMSAEEVVTRHLGEVARDHAERLSDADLAAGTVRGGDGDVA